MADTMGKLGARTWGGRGRGRRTTRERERNACAQPRERKRGGGGERKRGKASCLCVLSLSFCCSFLSLPPCSRWLCFGRLSPLAFLDLVAQIQGGKEKGRQAKAAVVVVVKQKEQGAQMAVDSSGVDKAVCRSPRGQYGNGTDNSRPIFGGFSVYHLREKKKKRNL